MANADTVLRVDGNGKIWAHRVKKNGEVAKCGSVVSQTKADEMLASGEAEWERAPKSSPAPSRETREQWVQRMADRGVPIQVNNWGYAMNRDD